MIRTLIAALLLIGLLSNLDHSLPEVLLGYALIVAAILWLTWPMLRALRRGLRHARRRHHRPAQTHAAAPTAPHLTQINHHHYYYGPNQAPPAPAMPHHIDRTLPALPQQTEQQRMSTSIYDILDLDDEGPDR
jgi:ABC-type nickel/cobalt efflux system permease component RcnA